MLEQVLKSSSPRRKSFCQSTLTSEAPFGAKSALSSNVPSFACGSAFGIASAFGSGPNAVITPIFGSTTPAIGDVAAAISKPEWDLLLPMPYQNPPMGWIRYMLSNSSSDNSLCSMLLFQQLFASANVRRTSYILVIFRWLANLCTILVILEAPKNNKNIRFSLK